MGFDPITIGVGLAVGSSLLKGQKEKDAANYNAALSDYEAEYAKKKAILDERRLREDESRAIGTARAVAGATGFRTDVGTNADIVADIMNSAAIDAAAIRAFGSVSETRFKSQADLLREQGSAAQTASFFDAGSSLFSGISAFRNKRASSSQLRTN